MVDLPAQLPVLVFVADKSWSAKNGETLQRLRKALNETVASIEADEEKAKSDVNKSL